MYDDDKYIKDDYDGFGKLSNNHIETAEGVILELFANSIRLAAQKTKELVVDKVEKEKKKERINEKMAILEYVENAKNKKNFYTPNEIEEERIVEQIKSDDPDFNKELFEHYAEDVFRKLMIAYCENEVDSLRKYVDVNILELFKMQAAKNALTPEKEQIVIKQINYVDFFGYHKEGNLEFISAAIGVNYYDFATNDEGKVVKGSDKILNRSVYLVSFARKIGSKTINNIKDYKDGVAYCPNCGGKITNSYSECEFCHTILYNGTDNWILTHVEEM